MPKKIELGQTNVIWIIVIIQCCRVVQKLYYGMIYSCWHIKKKIINKARQWSFGTPANRSRQR